MAYFSRVRITAEMKAKVLRRLATGNEAGADEGQRAKLARQLQRAQQLFLMGDWSELSYLKEKA